MISDRGALTVTWDVKQLVERNIAVLSGVLALALGQVGWLIPSVYGEGCEDGHLGPLHCGMGRIPYSVLLFAVGAFLGWIRRSGAVAIGPATGAQLTAALVLEVGVLFAGVGWAPQWLPVVSGPFDIWLAAGVGAGVGLFLVVAGPRSKTLGGRKYSHAVLLVLLSGLTVFPWLLYGISDDGLLLANHTGIAGLVVWLSNWTWATVMLVAWASIGVSYWMERRSDRWAAAIAMVPVVCFHICWWVLSIHVFYDDFNGQVVFDSYAYRYFAISPSSWEGVEDLREQVVSCGYVTYVVDSDRGRFLQAIPISVGPLGFNAEELAEQWPGRLEATLPAPVGQEPLCEQIMP